MQTNNYAHVFSLGHACAVAHEIEEMGYRHHSGPFDWQASRSLSPKIELINTGFKSFFENLTVDTLYQRCVPSTYYMPACDIYFVHDFDAYRPLSEQIEGVKKKYERRVMSFLKDIHDKCLFIYYLYDQIDADWIEQNIEYVNTTLTKYNKESKIVFIAPPHLQINFECYKVENDFGKDIAYDFTKKNPEIRDFLSRIPYSKKQRIRNILFFYRKQIRKKTKELKHRLLTNKTTKDIEIYHHYMKSNDD